MASQLEPSEPTRHDLVFSGLSNLTDSISFSPQASNPDFNAKVFWSVNAFILFLIFLTVLWCCFIQRCVFNGTDRRLASDQFYQARLQRQREAAKTESPEKRREKLFASFLRHRVQMTVKEGDLINKNGKCDFADDCSIKETNFEENQAGSDVHEDDCNRHHNDIETGENDSSFSSNEEETGELKLRTGMLVPNCCAICLSDYRVGEVVTWSSNPKCMHAFHRECVVDWLIKMQPETPCPCCRQEFTDLEEIRKERSIKWVGTSAFDFNAVRFW